MSNGLPERQAAAKVLMDGQVDRSTQAGASEGKLTAALGEELFQRAPAAILCLDRDYNFAFANQAAMHLCGTTAIVGQNLWTLFPGTLDEPFSSCYRSTMEERVEREFEAFYGQPLNQWFKVKALPIEMGMAIFFNEIGERTRANSLNDLLGAVQQVALVATWTLDTATGRMQYGAGSYPIFGHAPEAVSTLDDLLKIVLPTDRERVLATTRAAVRDRTAFTVDFEVMGADGKTICVEVRGQVLAEREAGLRLGGIAIDINERKRGEVALLAKQHETERQRAELETIYRTADIGLALFAAGDLRCLRINDYEAQILGLPPEQVVGRTLMELAPDVPGLEQIFRGVEAGTPVRDMIVEGELPARPGESRVWSVSYAPVLGDEGKVVAIAAASLEITQQRRTQAALMHSEKLAAVGRLASSISHEINNPLEAVTNLLYIIETDEKLPAELKGYVETAQSELSRVSQIATQTLRFHRHASQPTRVTAAALVDAVMDLYHGRLFNSGIRVERLYRTERTMLCFENDLRQVLNNLIANAIDAMPKGGRLVARAHETVDEEGRAWVRITVADTGHGMSKLTASRIFDPFFTTKDLNGTGLGLWISSEIVGRHHGRLRVRSATGTQRGTVFTLVLPCDDPPDEAPNPSAYASLAG